MSEKNAILRNHFSKNDNFFANFCQNNYQKHQVKQNFK